MAEEITQLDSMIAALDHTQPGFDSVYARALNAIHYDVDSARIKGELVQYAKTIGLGEVAEQVPANRIMVEGSIAYCLNRGAKLKPTSIERVKNWLEEQRAEAPEAAPDWEELPSTARGRATLTYVDCYSLLDAARQRVELGKMSQRDLTTYVRKIVSERGGNKHALIRQLLEHYRQSLGEARLDASIKGWVRPLTTIVDALGVLAGSRSAVKSSARGARARKRNAELGTVDRKGERAASKVTYKEEDTDLGITSIDPVNVVGAEAVVVYNTKTRHCEVYHALPGQKLSVQGARISNFDPARSGGKTIRQPETTLPHWTRAATVKRLDVLLEGTRGKRWTPSGKLNHNTVIIKAF
jgi:hypothetical protein